METGTKKSTLDNYTNILEVLGKVLTYTSVALATTTIFGFIYIISFLYASGLLWLFSHIEYQTIIVWGLPPTIILFSVFALSAFVHEISDKFINNKMLSSLVYIIVFIIIVFMVLSYQNDTYLGNYVVHAIYSLLIFFTTIFLLLKKRKKLKMLKFLI